MQAIASDNDDSSKQLPAGAARLLPLWEIASVMTSCLIAEWVVLVFIGNNKLVLAIPVGLAVAFIFLSQRERGETLRDLGLRTDNFIACCRLLVLPTAVAVLTIIVFGWWTRSFAGAASWRWRFLALPVWALFQQYVLNGFINRRAQMAFGPGTKCIVLVAIVFGLLHLPSPLLATLTMIAGAVWAFVYQRAPNLYALALSHAIASLTLALAVSPHWLNGLRVGFKYFG